jgi:hypothetical protein
LTERGTRTPAFRATLGLAGVAVVSVLIEILLEALRGSDECNTAMTTAITATIWIALVSSVLALVLGVVALVERSGGVGWVVAGMTAAVVVAVPIITASTWGTYACSGGAA